MEEQEWEIRWSDTLNIDVPEIDQEHRQFVARVNEFNQAIVQCKDKATIERLLDSMLTEATHHFWHEQQLLAQWKYPERADHAAKHAQLTAHIAGVMRDFKQADVSFTWALKGLHIKQLLVEHLIKDDVKYRDFLRKQQSPNSSQDGGQRARRRAMRMQ